MSDALMSAARAIVQDDENLLEMDDDHTAVTNKALLKLGAAVAAETSERRARHRARGAEQERRAQWAHAQRVLSLASLVNDWLADTETPIEARGAVMEEMDVKCAQALYMLLDNAAARIAIREAFFPDVAGPTE